MGLNQDIINYFNGKDIDIRTYSPLTFAYIGDDVFDLIIRTVVVNRGNSHPDKMHNAAVRYVSAVAQAKMYETILPLLDEEEADILRRGRNSKPHTKAKNASSEEYMKATALETLVGYLYLKNDEERIFELLQAGIESIDSN